MPLHKIDAYPEKACEVHVYKKGKTVWIATGDFMGEPLQVKAGTEVGAVRVWREVAEGRYRGT